MELIKRAKPNISKAGIDFSALECDECYEDSKMLVSLGITNNEQDAQWICPSCLVKALSLTGENIEIKIHSTGESSAAALIATFGK